MKLFAIWRKIEVPSRAPPLTWEITQSMAAYEWEHGHYEMATILLVVFHCLLRTGEFLQFTAGDISLGEESFPLKGQRQACEAISITSHLVLEFMRPLADARRQLGTTALPLWSQNAASFRTRFRFLTELMGLEGHNLHPIHSGEERRICFNRHAPWKRH